MNLVKNYIGAISQTSEKNASMVKRIVWVDYFKALGIFLIVWGHAFIDFKDLTYFLFTFHVPLFFFVSGYLEKTAPTNIKNYIYKVLFTLVSPYIIWNLLSFVFHPHYSFSHLFSLITGFSRWNGASWFLMVLAFLKINALFYKNRKYIIAIPLTILLIAISLWGGVNKDIRLPFIIELTFIFMPFFFFGMYGKKIIDYISKNLSNKLVCFLGALFSFILLIILYNFSPILHTHSIRDFISQFHMLWISGFLGIISLFMLCHCFGNVERKLVTLISSATLFIMCSHYEIFSFITPYLTVNYGDFVTHTFVFCFFILQCAFIPIIIKYFPLLAGRYYRKKIDYKLT